MAVAGIAVIVVSLVPIAWNLMQLSTLDAEGDFEAWMNIVFTLLAAVVIAAVLALLATWGPPAAGVALATLPLLLGLLLGMLFDIPPVEQPIQLDLETQRHNVRRLALWNGVLAAAAGLLALVQTVSRSPA